MLIGLVVLGHVVNHEIVEHMLFLASGPRAGQNVRYEHHQREGVCEFLYAKLAIRCVLDN